MPFRTAPTLSQPSKPPSSIPAPGLPDACAAAREPLAVYIHWPFCQSKCPYCDFNSYAKRSIGEEEFVKAAIAELRHYAGLTAGRPVPSIFFGGGTPSLMAPATVAALLDAVASLWPVEPACEITLEGNPSSVEAGRFAGYRAAGVNRVSLGVQSLNDGELRFLGRLHTAAEARQALGVAHRQFERVTFDLIYARPGQTPVEWRSELTAALGLARGHLSLYQLTIEPETAFFELHKRGKLRIPAAELAADLYDLTQEVCEAAGLPAYEVSNHAAPGQESRHNLTYWRYGDYVGAGPGAHGRIAAGQAKIATAAVKEPAAWAARVFERGHGRAERCELSALEQAAEMVLMGLRLSEGLNLARLEARTGYTLAPAELVQLENDGLLSREGSRVSVSSRGRLVLNAIVETLASGLTLKEFTGHNCRVIPARCG
ncbi:MAG: radical SAM family heme chaperone HemW [Rhodomicrobium sp.]